MDEILKMDEILNLVARYAAYVRTEEQIRAVARLLDGGDAKNNLLLQLMEAVQLQDSTMSELIEKLREEGAQNA